jgi:hypothetical protein
MLTDTSTSNACTPTTRPRMHWDFGWLGSIDHKDPVSPRWISQGATYGHILLRKNTEASDQQ